MSTTGIDSWAVDLAEVTAIHPFQGTEFVLFIVGLAFWVIWHVWQLRSENAGYEDDVAKLNSPEKIEKAMREQRLD